MSTLRSLLAIACLSSLLLAGGCTKQYIITTDLERPLAGTSALTVGEVTDEFPADFDVSKKPSLDEIERFKHLIMAELAETGLFSSQASGPDSAVYQVQGSILDYKKGSGVVRAFIGFGIGNAKVTTSLKLVNAKTNEVVFAGNFQGTVSDWAEKGNEVFDKTAKNFAKALKKQMKELNKKAAKS